MAFSAKPPRRLGPQSNREGPRLFFGCAQNQLSSGCGEKICARLLRKELMSVAIVTGSAGLIGSETCKRFHAEGFEVVGIDNDMRARFFGPEASTRGTKEGLEKALKGYQHEDLDIR